MDKQQLAELSVGFNAIITQAGIPGGLVRQWDIIGRNYCFFAEHGSHKYSLAGKIEAVYCSDEAGLRLEISNSRFWGQGKIIDLSFNNGEWSLCVEFEEPTKNKQYFTGHVQFLGSTR